MNALTEWQSVDNWRTTEGDMSCRDYEYRRQLRGSTSSTATTHDRHDSRQTALDSLLQQRRKRKKVCRYGTNTDHKKRDHVFDAKGIHVISGLDLCDCLDTSCDGCFFRCANKKCKSNKCGSDCRQKRKFYYESIEDQIHDYSKRVNTLAMKCDPNRQVVHLS